MTVRPYPSVHRAARQLDRHSSGTPNDPYDVVVEFTNSPVMIAVGEGVRRIQHSAAVALVAMGQQMRNTRRP